MIPQQRHLLVRTFKLIDLVNMLSCFLLAAFLIDRPAQGIDFNEFLAMRVSVRNVIIFLGFLLAWSAIFSWNKLYDSRRLSTLWPEVVDVVKATFTGTVALLSLSLAFRIEMVNTPFLVIFFVLVTVMTTMLRLVLRLGLKRLRIRGRNLRNIVIVGTGSRAIGLARKILSRPELGYRLTGFVDDEEGNLAQLNQSGYPLVADFAGFPEYLRNNVVDEVMVTLPMKSCYQHAAQIASLCEKHGIIVRVLSDLFEMKLARSRSEQFEGDSIVTLYTGRMVGGGIVVKRILDLVLSLVLLITLSPVLLMAALLVKASSEGAVFFTQQRLGVNKRRFGMHKFRTMFPDAEKRLAGLEHLNEASGPVFKIRNDPRITPIGRFLRKTSIDELPQLLNVLKGDMSLVGPRPLPVRDYEGFDRDWHRRRFSVRPGITCLWQISGRSNITFDRWMELDMEYIDNWTLWMDVRILLLTIPAVLKGSGAA